MLTIAPPPRAHGPDAELDTQHDAAQIEVERSAPVTGIRFREVRLGGTAGVVDYDAEVPEAPLCGGKRFPQIRLDGHVGRDEGRAATICLDPAGGVCTASGYINDDHGGALAPQPQGYGATDASAGSRNECNLVLHAPICPLAR